MKYICRICDREFTEAKIPAEATKVTGTSRHSVAHLWPNGEFHDLRPVNPKHKLAMHNKWHVGKAKYSGCEFCYPPKPEPEVPVALEPIAEQQPPEPDPGVQVFLAEEDPLGQEVAAVERVESPTLELPAEFGDTIFGAAFKKYKEGK